MYGENPDVVERPEASSSQSMSELRTDWGLADTCIVQGEEWLGATRLRPLFLIRAESADGPHCTVYQASSSLDNPGPCTDAFPPLCWCLVGRGEKPYRAWSISRWQGPVRRSPTFVPTRFSLNSPLHPYPLSQYTHDTLLARLTRSEYAVSSSG